MVLALHPARVARVARAAFALALVGAAVGFAPRSALAQEPAVPDRVAVRFITPETGGVAHPRFLTERQIAFFTRVEAITEQLPVEADIYPERYVRTATDRLVARAMLSSLLVQRGSEPPDLPRLTLEARATLADRLGGNAVLDDAMQHEGIDEQELLGFVRDQVRATWYLDQAVTPLLAVSEDALREVFRSALHPFRALKFDDARVRLRAWLISERMRAAELEFLQSARARIKIATVLPPASSPSSPSPQPTP